MITLGYGTKAGLTWGLGNAVLIPNIQRRRVWGEVQFQDIEVKIEEKDIGDGQFQTR